MAMKRIFEMSVLLAVIACGVLYGQRALVSSAPMAVAAASLSQFADPAQVSADARRITFGGDGPGHPADLNGDGTASREFHEIGQRAVQAEFGLIEICHCRRGNPKNCRTITIDPAALPAHLAHGDTLGPCEEDLQQLGARLEEACDLQEAVEVMEQAAALFGVSIESESVVVGENSETRLSTAALPGQLTLEDLENGADILFTYMSLPDAAPDIPPGFYTIRVTAPPGAEPVAEVLDEDGETVATLQATVQTGEECPEPCDVPNLAGEQIDPVSIVLHWLGICCFDGICVECWLFIILF